MENKISLTEVTFDSATLDGERAIKLTHRDTGKVVVVKVIKSHYKTIENGLDLLYKIVSCTKK